MNLKTASLLNVGALVFFTSLTVAGCSTSSSIVPSPNTSAGITTNVPDEMEQQAATTLKFAQTLLGMAQAYAENKIEEAGYEHRMVWKDGESLAITMDYRPTRINLYIKEGIVDKVDVS